MNQSNKFQMLLNLENTGEQDSESSKEWLLNKDADLGPHCPHLQF